jgi:hypothetical protein
MMLKVAPVYYIYMGAPFFILGLRCGGVSIE